MNLLMTLTASAAALAMSAGMSGASTVAFDILNVSADKGTENEAHVFGAGYGAFTPGGWSWSPASGPSVQTGSMDNIYLSPWAGNATAEANNSYFAVGPNQVTQPQSVTLNFGANVSSFTMLLGSVDTYNNFSFGGLGAVDGTQIANSAGSPCVAGGNPPNGNFGCTVRLRFSVNPSEDGQAYFTTMTVSSSSQAAEFALIPLPASALLLLTGMGALGGLTAIRRRREKASA